MGNATLRHLELSRELLATLEGAGATITWINAAWGSVLGVDPQELLGKSWIELLPEAWRDRGRDLLEAVRGGGEPRRDVRIPIMESSGGIHWVEWSLAAELPEAGAAGGGGQLALVGHDIDAELQVEARRAELERERRLFIGGPVIVFRWQAKEGWPVEYVSPNVAQQLGVTADDLRTGRVPYASIVHPEDLARVGAEVAQFSAEGRSTFEQDYRLVLPDGRLMWIYDFTVVNRDEAGAITHYEGYVVDITARKSAEEELRRQVELVERQREAIQSLSTPILQLWDGVLALPVVGHVDSSRAAEMMDGLLQGVVETSSRHAVLDLTGVEIMDTMTARHLLQMVSAAGLLGAECVISGIKGEVAQTLIAAGVDLAGVRTFSRLRDALRYAIRAGR